MLRLLALAVAAIALAAAACGGGDSDPAPPPAAQPAVEVANGSPRLVQMRWYPKEGQRETGADVVPACTTKRVRVPAGPYTIVLTSYAETASFGWVVTAEKPCCVGIRRDGTIHVTAEHPAPARCS